MINDPPRIYIDQNGWIALSRQFYGRDPSNRCHEVLNALTAASEADEVRVPLSFGHLVEVCASGDMERRKRLAAFMVKVSKQYALVPFDLVRHEETMEAVVRRLGVDGQWFNRERLVQKGLWCALGLEPTFEGGEPEQVKLLEDILRSDAVAEKMLSEWMSSDAGRALRQRTEQEAVILNRIRHAQLGQQGRVGKRLADSMAVIDEMILPIAEAECQKVGIDPARLHETFGNDEDKLEFARSIPSYDVLLSLMLARDEEAQRDIDRNDMRDIAFLATAIPYCDVVVTERYFGNVALRLKLDERYECTILTDVSSLTAHLPNSGATDD